MSWLKEKIEAQLGMEVKVTPVLVFTNAHVYYGGPVHGVYYRNVEFLLNFICATDASLPPGLKL
jgi:hypothetical protein